MNEAFEARNDLEHKLLAAQEGRLDIDAFMDELLKAQLFLPMLDNAAGGLIQRSTHGQPLALDAKGGARVLVLFTSPDRARSFVKDYPGYEGGILTDLHWVFDHLGMGFGIALNPGWEVGLDLEPDMVAQLAQRSHVS
jgi:hypothetical protein